VGVWWAALIGEASAGALILYAAGLAALAAGAEAVDFAAGAAGFGFDWGLIRSAGAYLLAHLACRTLAWKTPSAAVRTLSQSLGIVFECVRRGLGALVCDFEQAPCWGFRGVAFKTRFSTKSTCVPFCSIEPGTTNLHAQLAVVGLVAQAAQLRNGYVVAFVGPVAGKTPARRLFRV